MPRSGPVEFEVIYSVWGAGEDEFAGGVHTVEAPTREFLRLLAGAEAAGVVRVLDAPRAALDPHVQSQEDGEKAYDRAQKSGAWRHGQLVNVTLNAQDRLAFADTGEPGSELTDTERALLEHQLAVAKAELEDTEAP